jgi:hypothetical protein
MYIYKTTSPPQPALNSPVARNKNKLHISTIPAAHAAPPPLEPLAPLVRPKHGAGQQDEREHVKQAQRLGLEDALERGKVDDEGLAEQAASHGVVEHLVLAEADLAAQHALGLGAARERVEHVEEDEAGEGHGGVARGHDAVYAHFVHVNGEGAEHDYGGGLDHAFKERWCDGAGVFAARWARHYCWIYRLDAE